MLNVLVPDRLATTARRASTLLVTLGLLVYFLFPQAASAGTETSSDRIVTTALLVVAGLLARFTAERGGLSLAVLIVHAGAQFAVGAAWAGVASLLFVAMGALSWVRRPAGEDDLAPPPEMTGADHVRENVEAIAMALILALTVKTFVYEAFQIPTSSMEPTILGANARKNKPGDRLLASKVQMFLGDPPRWSIVVFKYPLFRPVNYIKRLVGLPGERLEIRDGDIYVNGNVVAKPEEVQETLWFPLYRAANARDDLSTELEQDDQVATWSIGKDAATVEVPADQTSRVRFIQSLGAEDLRVNAKLTLQRSAESGAVKITVEGGRRRVEATFGVDGGTLDAPGMDALSVPDARLTDDPETEYGLGVADRVARLYVNGRLVARIETADKSNGGAQLGAASIGFSGGKGAIHDVRVERDIEYQGRKEWKIGKDEFFMLGDNVGGSKDSRKWYVNVITTANGTVYKAEDSVKLEDGRVVRLKQNDGKWRFLDVEGVLREVPVEGTDVQTNVPAPFVRRRDLVGRAFVIFFPFPPIADWRPRFLP